MYVIQYIISETTDMFDLFNRYLVEHFYDKFILDVVTFHKYPMVPLMEFSLFKVLYTLHVFILHNSHAMDMLSHTLPFRSL